MAHISREFGELLRAGVYRIHLRESKSIQAVQDELGYALDRSGGSAIDFWRRGNVPSNADVERLAREIIRRSDVQRDWLERFLLHGRYVDARRLCDELFPSGQAKIAVPTGRPTRSAHGVEEELAPFVTGSPITHPRQFWGRERELRNLFPSLGRVPLRHTAIIGQQRSGKTSLLHYLRQVTLAQPNQLRADQRSDWLPQPGRYRWVFVDFQDARMTSQEGLLRHLLTELGLMVPEPCTLTSFLNVMADQLRDRAVLLFDEVGAALEQEAFDQRFWWSMRSLMTNLTGGLLGCIVTAQRPPEEHADEIGKPSPFFNIFYRLDLGPLSEAETRALIAASPQPFEPAAAEWIIAHSQCWPILAQTLCHVRLMALENGEADNAWQDEGLRQIARYRHLLGGP